MRTALIKLQISRVQCSKESTPIWRGSRGKMRACLLPSVYHWLILQEKFLSSRISWCIWTDFYSKNGGSWIFASHKTLGGEEAGLEGEKPGKTICSMDLEQSQIKCTSRVWGWRFGLFFAFSSPVAQSPGFLSGKLAQAQWQASLPQPCTPMNRWWQGLCMALGGGCAYLAVEWKHSIPSCVWKGFSPISSSRSPPPQRRCSLVSGAGCSLAGLQT